MNPILKRATDYQEAMTQFLRDMVAIPSESMQEREVCARVQQEMERVGFDEVFIDGLGNVIGRIGSGATIIAMDAHLDTVGVGNPANWTVDPYKGAVKDGKIFGRGTVDMEGSMASMVYGAKIIKDLELFDDYTLYVTGTVMEEDCDGLCWQYILNEEVIPRPDCVVITEPTNLNIYRGHRGRMELNVTTSGVSCHGSAPERGVNAIYKMQPIIRAIERLNEEGCLDDEFLGKGTVTISEIRSTSPSLCAVADSCTIHLDRRLSVGESEEFVVSQLENLPEVKAAGATVTVLEYAERAYTGLLYPTRKFYPTWKLDEGAPELDAAIEAFRGVFESEPVVDKWTFSTNGIATMGMHGVPTVGFGPGNEVYAHAPDEFTWVEHLVKAAAFYAAFPQQYCARKRDAG
ncbi:MAG: YgeY family selenium metabolism-linked hydrolase [Myxococcales bacterium]|nr:YgeY family selenium metabolism-linked hydrolase [Myxococcales bacterium]